MAYIVSMPVGKGSIREQDQIQIIDFVSESVLRTQINDAIELAVAVSRARWRHVTRIDREQRLGLASAMAKISLYAFNTKVRLFGLEWSLHHLYDFERQRPIAIPIYEVDL